MNYALILESSLNNTVQCLKWTIKEGRMGDVPWLELVVWTTKDFSVPFFGGQVEILI